MEKGIFKRTTFVVEDAKSSADFYTHVFGWSIWYDNQLTADSRFPPVGTDQDSKVHLIILDAANSSVGKLGLLQYIDRTIESSERQHLKTIRIGDPILVIEYEDIDKVYERAKEKHARVITSPVDWQVPGPDGKSSIHLRTISLFDPNGIYMEVSAHPNRKQA